MSLWKELPLSRHRWLRALLLLVALGAGLAAAQDEPSLVWPEHGNLTADAWIDGSGTATLDDARRGLAAGMGHAADTDSVMPLGYGRAAWFRLNLPQVATPADAVFGVAFTGIDRVDLFRPDGTGGWTRQVSGDSVPVSQWPVRYLYPVFMLKLQPGEAQPTYLRVQHGYPIAVKWALWRPARFNEASKLWHLALGAAAGLMLLVVVLSLAHAVSWHDPIHFYYAVHVVLVGLSVASLTGVSGEYLWPDNPWWNDMAAIALPIAALGWMGVLVRELVAERGKRLVARLLLAHVVISTALVAGILVLGRQAFFEWPNLYALLGLSLLVGVLAWYSLRRPHVGLWVLGGMGMLMASSVLPVLRNLGIVHVNFGTQYGPQIGGVLEVPLVLIGLYFRSRERRDNRMRMDALSHTDPLTGVANHRVLVEQLERLLKRARKDRTLGGVLRVQVLNLPAIRAEYGREAAEAAVVRAAECITLEAAETDLVAREQGGDVVLLLEGKVSRAQAAEAARDIIARGLKFSGRLPPAVTLSLRIAGVCAPLPTESAAAVLATLSRELQSMAMEQTGRAIRILEPFDELAGG